MLSVTQDAVTRKMFVNCAVNYVLKDLTSMMVYLLRILVCNSQDFSVTLSCDMSRFPITGKELVVQGCLRVSSGAMQFLSINELEFCQGHGLYGSVN